MNCPECGAWTSISETRLTVMRYRRRRECGNGHRFTTIEQVIDTKRKKNDKTKVQVPAEQPVSLAR
jgi:transcriptional regulator NrdR family protein